MVKIGRPKLPEKEKKKGDITIYFKEEVKKILKKKAKEVDKPLSVYIKDNMRRGSLGKTVSIHKFLKDNIDTLNEMIKLNLNNRDKDDSDEITKYHEKKYKQLMENLKWNQDALKRAEKRPWEVESKIIIETAKAIENINKKLK